jgi:3-deoxy-manno-octulosonate cytidylyltransferase (CMP-KDO synthetase)
MKIVAVSPAHMASVRFPGKILFPFHGLPMIEHVRRRALISNVFSEVYVATCDDEIASVINRYNGKVIRTGSNHKNGTSRVAEAIREIDCTHVVLLQGDEPLLLPRHLIDITKAIISEPKIDAWNATGPIENPNELDRHSFVKCVVGNSQNILYCFRRSPCYSSPADQMKIIRKILGIISYKKGFLLKLTKLNESQIENLESIEQMRIIENGHSLKSVPVEPSLPSVNQRDEAEEVLLYMSQNLEQNDLLKQVLNFSDA